VWILEAFIVVSLVSVLVRRFCVPAYLYRRLASALGNSRVEVVRN
jgi:hypothetical protein